MTAKGALLIFAKTPIEGQVKTRLIPDIGSEAATSLYKELLTKTLDTANNTTFLDVQLWLSGDSSHPYIKNLNLDSHVLQQQRGNDLGERMYHAFEQLLNQYSYAILIGCDCPGLSDIDLKFAADMLESGKDIVLGPAEDGGYYLIGLNNNHIELFSNITWGENTVFSKTKSIAEDLGLNIGLLTVRRDIDRFSDLQAYKKMEKQECRL